jgi:Abortive infection alpha
MADPLTGAIVKAGTDAMAKSAEGLLSRLLGPAFDELAEVLRDKAQRYRQANIVRTLDHANVLLSRAGVEPVLLPMKILLPLIEGASLEDEHDLARRWAGLIATAAASDAENLRHPGFARLLSELTSREAHMIDALNDAGGTMPWGPLRSQFATRFGCSEEAVRVAHGNIFRLGIWSNTSSQDGMGSVVDLNPFGRAFIAATHGPLPPGQNRSDGKRGISESK